MENPGERARELHKEPRPPLPGSNETEFERMHYGDQQREREREREKKNKGTTINGGNGDNGRWDKQAGKQWSLEMKDGGGQRRGPRSGGRWKSGGGLEEWITRDKEP